MKKSFFILIAFVLMAGITNAQKVEVLYFKANLACCHARACNQLESQVKSVIEKNYQNGDVVFITVPIGIAENQELVDKYNASSQSVVIVSKKRRKETITDATAIVRDFRRTRNMEAFEQSLTQEINKVL